MTSDGGSAEDLSGLTLVVTRPPHQAPLMVNEIEKRGGTATLYPTIVIGPPDAAELTSTRRYLAALTEGEYDAVLFTSVNAVTHTRELLLLDHTPWASLDVELFAIGEATAAAVADLGRAPRVARRSVGEGLVDAVLAHFGTVAGKRFLLPRARDGRVTVLEGLEKHGARVDLAIVYATVPAPIAPPLPAIGIDWVTFTSPSAVRAFVERSALPPGAKSAAIGPTTAEAMRNLGIEPSVVPETQSLGAMLDAISQASSELP